MPATYRGARVSDITDALDKTARLLINERIGPRVNTELRRWLAPGGPVERLGNGEDARSIMEGKDSPGWVAQVIVPAVERLALLGKTINGVDAVDAYQALGRSGVLSQGRITMMTPEDVEVADFISRLPRPRKTAKLPGVDEPMSMWHAQFGSENAVRVARERFTQKLAELGKSDDLGMIGTSYGPSLMVESTAEARKVFEQMFPKITILSDREARLKFRARRDKKNPPKPPRADRRRTAMPRP
ncbi:MAG: hypothetical protein Alpg2KO_25720 [Alphaproteobacteria bacterium]